MVQCQREFHQQSVEQITEDYSASPYTGSDISAEKIREYINKNSDATLEIEALNLTVSRHLSKMGLKKTLHPNGQKRVVVEREQWQEKHLSANDM